MKNYSLEDFKDDAQIFVCASLLLFLTVGAPL